MKISENIYIQEDIENLAMSFKTDFLYEKSVLITGATGLLGSELVYFLAYINKKFNANIKIYALVRNENKAKEKFKYILNDINLYVQDINNDIEINDKIDFIIHCASVTSSAKMVEQPIETLLTSINGTKNVLNFALDKKIQSMVYLSSLEVYGNKKEDVLIDENHLGQLNALNIRSSYPLGKQVAENLCVSYCKQHNLNIKIARLTQTFGPGIDYDDNRVFAQFAKSAILNKNIILHTLGNTIRNYCYITDAVSGILTILKSGNSSEAYNIANENTSISIKDMANLVAKTNNIKVEFQIDNINRGYNPEIKMCLSSEKLQKLNWTPVIDLETMFFRLIASLKTENNKKVDN